MSPKITCLLHNRVPAIRSLPLILRKLPDMLNAPDEALDTIYAGSIAAGGSFPDYSQSSAEEVILFLRRVVPDEAFRNHMIGDEERRRGAPLPVWSLIVLSLLREHRRLTRGPIVRFFLI